MAGIFTRKEGRNLGFFAAVALLLAAALAFAFAYPLRAPTPSLGVTFSTTYARYLGLDPRETFSALLDDAGVRRFRIPVYWSETEPAEGEYRFDDLDWMMSEAEARGAQVMLAIGAKVPRWPECYVPDWAVSGDGSFDRGKLAAFLETVVRRYAASPALVRWQVENEPYLSFGTCPKADPGQIDHEIALVRSLDARPVAMTVSGELEAWGSSATQADALGISLYRTTWNRYLGRVRYPIPALAYRLRAALVRASGHEIFVSELQAEPWFPNGVRSRDVADGYALFTDDDLRDNVTFAARTGIADVDLWGAEWWYYLHKNGEPRLWNEAKRLFGR